ncbi:MAG: hypothetical protein WD941_03805 [Opitutus sp.]
MKILLFFYFTSWAFIPHLLFLKKRPAATLAWLWAILFIPLLGASSAQHPISPAAPSR